MFKDFIQGFTDLVYPPHCVLCQKPLLTRLSRGFLCPPCRGTIKLNHPPFCPKCSRPLGRLPAYARCPSCRKADHAFDFAWSACLYEEPLRGLLHRYKYHQKTYLRFEFLHLIVTFISTYNFDIQQFDTIVPIPLSPCRYRERGYNQAALLAEVMAQHFKIKLSPRHLIRIRPTRPQSTLTQKERWTNVHGAFRIKRPSGLKNKSVLILDDLLTTGATVSEAATVLKQAGAETVGVLTLATSMTEG